MGKGWQKTNIKSIKITNIRKSKKYYSNKILREKRNNIKGILDILNIFIKKVVPDMLVTLWTRTRKYTVQHE